MKAPPRSLVYLVPTILIVLAVGWVGFHTWKDVRQLHQSFASVKADDIYIPAYVEATIHELNDVVVKTILHQDPKDQAVFEKSSQELQEWISNRQNTLTTMEQRELLDQIFAANEVYLTRDRELMQRPPDSYNGNEIALIAELESNSKPVVDLCRKLMESERAEQVKFMKNSQQSLTWIQDLTMVVMVMLMSLVIAAGVAVFRGVIGPLRVELNRSRTLAMRNEKLASLGTLAAGVAHEIRNPLTAINVRLHSLKKNLPNNSSEQEDALVIGDEIDRLERIVQEFLQFARPAEPKFVIVSVDSLLAKAQLLLRTQLEKAAIELKLENIPDIWVRVDPHQMEQVLINLIKNAADFMEQGGTITLRVGTVTKRQGGRYVAMVSLEVIDTGPGIAPEIMKHIFDPFFSTKEQGTGLGLVIASRIIEKHHGTLECRSELNRGTTFTILLPKLSPGEIDEPAN